MSEKFKSKNLRNVGIEVEIPESYDYLETESLKSIEESINMYSKAKRMFEMLPSAQAVNAIRKAVLNNATIFQVLPNLLNLSIFTIFSLTLSYLVARIARKRVMIIGI